MRQDFYKKWPAPVVDSAISYLNKTLAGPVDQVTVFEVELKALFILIMCRSLQVTGHWQKLCWKGPQCTLL